MSDLTPTGEAPHAARWLICPFTCFGRLSRKLSGRRRGQQPADSRLAGDRPISSRRAADRARPGPARAAARSGAGARGRSRGEPIRSPETDRPAVGAGPADRPSSSILRHTPHSPHENVTSKSGEYGARTRRASHAPSGSFMLRTKIGCRKRRSMGTDTWSIWTDVSEPRADPGESRSGRRDPVGRRRRAGGPPILLILLILLTKMWGQEVGSMAPTSLGLPCSTCSTCSTRESDVKNCGAWPPAAMGLPDALRIPTRWRPGKTKESWLLASRVLPGGPGHRDPRGATGSRTRLAPRDLGAGRRVPVWSWPGGRGEPIGPAMRRRRYGRPIAPERERAGRTRGSGPGQTATAGTDPIGPGRLEPRSGRRHLAASPSDI
jgi:hypothetical protein